MLAKRNTFTDFVACARLAGAEELHRGPTGWPPAAAAPAGLLMGAVANLAPDAFRAIHAQVPFVDALTTILDPDLPLTVTEWEEWGDPLHDPEVYAYMKSYTPVRERATDGVPGDPGDDQPQRHPGLLRRARQVGRRAAGHGRDATAEDRPILLKTEMVAGHGGVSGRYQAGTRWPSNTPGSSTRSAERA